MLLLITPNSKYIKNECTMKIEALKVNLKNAQQPILLLNVT